MRSFRFCIPGLAILGLISGCNGGSNGSNGSGAPSHLVYPDISFEATRTEAINPDTPTVSGTVTGYSISPALPAGLTLDAKSGTISGTPTAVSPITNYAVTASNSVGSTTATVQIRVVDTEPQDLSYASPTIGALVGTAIAPDTPSNTGGIISSYTISPALPAGLNLNPTTGVISGTPTVPSPATAYEIAGSNAIGGTGASVTISVGQPASVLLDLGNFGEIQALQTNGSQVISEDQFGHWVLWDYASGNMIQSGDGAETADDHGVAVAGQVAVVSTSQGILVYSATTGTQTATIPASPWFSLASDGSYVATGSSTTLTVWTAAGQTEFTHSGDYHAASAFAAPGQVQVALGAAGANVIETLTVPAGNSSVSPSFSGAFNAWFTDGQKFLSNTGDTVWVYSSAGAQLGISSLPAITGLGGEGNWIWVITTGGSGTSPTYALQIYAVGGTTPVQTFQTAGGLDVGSGSTIGVFAEYGTTVSVVDLSGSSPVKTDYSVPGGGVAYAATSSANWILGNYYGAVLDGASVSTTPRYFSYGAALSIACGANTWAIATGSGQTLLYDLSKSAKIGTIDFPANEVAFSADGTILGAAAGWGASFTNDTTLNFYSVPSLTVIDSIPSQYNTNGVPYLSQFTLSGSGTTVGQLQEINSTTSDEISGLTGSPETNVGTGSVFPLGVPLLSPDGTLAAVSIQETNDTADETTNIYKNGTLVSAVSGIAVGWIDNNDLLAQVLTPVQGSGPQVSSTIYSAAGATVSTLPTNALPAMASSSTFGTPVFPQFPTSSSVYDPGTNEIYSLTDGSVLWQGTNASEGGAMGAVCGSTVVYAFGHQVFKAAYK